MTHIMPDYAYSDAPRERCYWSGTATPPACPTACPTTEGDLRAEVAIIGGGFTGLSAALHLAQAGTDVALFEAHTPGWGASGRNGGFCCLGGSAASDRSLTRRFGEPARRAYRQTEKHAIELVAALIKDHAILADCHSQGETELALSPRGLRDLHDKAGRLRADLGVTPELIPGEALKERGMSGPFTGALTIPAGFALNPLKYATGLARAAQEHGARLFANSPVTSVTVQNGFRLHHPQGTLTAERVVFATNGYSSDTLPHWLAGRYMPVQSNILVTRPLTDEEIAEQGWSTAQMAYDELFFLHYFRLMPNRSFLFGMRGGLVASPAADAAMERRLRQHFEQMFPAWAHVTTPHFWTGLLSLARDLTPFAGAIPDMPGAFAALNYHGNGVAMGSYAGALIADLVRGVPTTRPYPEILQTPPRRWPGGRYRKASLWPTYLWANLRGA